MTVFTSYSEFSNRPTTAGEIAEGYVRSYLLSLSDDYTVFCNLSIMNRVAQNLSEVDDVVVTPTGAMVLLEVKHGNLEQDEKGDTVRTYDGQTKSISFQTSKQYHLIKSRLLARFPSAEFRIRHYIVLPTGTVETTGHINDVGSIVIDSKNLSRLPSIIQDVDRIPIQGQTVSAKDIVTFLSNSFQVIPDVSALVDMSRRIEQEHSAGLSDWVPKIETVVPVIEVEAPAGAGKTRLAVTLLTKAAEEGKRAIYLGFHRNNVERLRKTPIATKCAFIGTWHEFAQERCAPRDNPHLMTYDERAKWFDDISQRLCERLMNSAVVYDLIVVDGAEDFEIQWIEALANALSPTGHLYTLRDNCLDAGKGEPEFNDADHIRISSFETARIPQKRCEEMLMMGIVPLAFTSSHPKDGENTAIRVLQSGETFEHATTEQIEEALRKGYSEEDICVLTMHGINSSQIMKHEALGKHRLKKPTMRFDERGDMVFTEGEIFCDTIRRFKGLQSPCVILTEVDFETVTETEKSLLYLAMTRSGVRLVMVMTSKACQSLLA